ncbi:uncharacterized protein LOC124922650 isoform X2 [Impatiens glandulifera]|uniref:uncharacterized protein LOC124922650 isoform X2 n=1 Tax=Impatiens glandulifera TaxID=253017 RepID=UPI001FB13C9D|nr:uncharacterized protein LOC124922650 isoform X2 [Impatiens glandulifera]
MDEGMRSSGGSVKKKKMNSKKGGSSNLSRSAKKSYTRKEKKPRVVSSDSESSQEELASSTPGKFRNNVTDDSDSGQNCEAVSDRKRRLDVFEFDEYDVSDVKKMRKEKNLQNSFKLTGKGRNLTKSECGSSKPVMAVKRKDSSNDSAASDGSSEDDDDDEAHLPILSLRQKSRITKSSDEAIRLPGKNGVLKVTASKKKLDKPHKGKSSETVKESRKEKNHQKPKEESPRGRGSSRLKTSSSQKTPPILAGKQKRGRATEKQLLREKIKHMLIEAGWTIDYRPRKDRDYLDSVYINPSGTGFWSITKAYDALQKQSVEEDDVKIKPGGNSDGFTPLPNELINKLTRQTRKKIEKKMKNSSDDDNEDGDDEKKEISDSIQRRKNRKIGRCTLLARSSDEHRTSESDNYIPYRGKRTVLLWLVDSGTVKLSEKVTYMNRRHTKVMLEGWIAKDGIHCSCCSKILSVTKFEIHAGNKLRQPFQNIFLESGSSLLQCQIDAWNRQDESKRKGFHTVHTDSDDPNDDTCGLCGDGGDLICCDGCPSTFHQNCLGLKMLPDGDWHCLNCTCKFCGILSENIPEADSTSALLRCNLCEKRYHESCSEGITDSTMSFCGKDCKRIFDRMEKLLGVKHELEERFSWSLIRRSDLLDIDERNSGYSNKVESNSKLAVALSVMDECFLPIVDRRSGFNMIHNVLYNCGSNFSRLNYSGFYTVILEKGDEIIAAASIRIHGTQLAEMPFIGTRHLYRRQGMCRRLLGAIESVLRSVKVNRLVIPAISEHMHTWKVAFGFSRLNNPQKQEMKLLNMLVFPGIDMLQKPLLENTSNIEVGQEIPECDDDEINDKASTEDSIMQDAVIPSSDNLGLSDTTESRSEEAKAVLVESTSCPSEAPVPISDTVATHTKENGTEKLETAGAEIFATEIESPEDSILQEAVIPSSDNLGLSDTTESPRQVTVNEEAKAVLAESISCPSEAPIPVSETVATHTKENGTKKLETAGAEIFATEIESPEESILQEAVVPSSDNLGLSDITESPRQVTVNEEAKAVLVEAISCPSEAPVPVSESVATHMKENSTEKLETAGDEIFATVIESPEDSIMQEAVIPSSENLGLSDATESPSQVTANEKAKAVLVESISSPSEAPIPVSETLATHTKENGTEKLETAGDEIFAPEIESPEDSIMQEASSDNLGLSDTTELRSQVTVNEKAKAVLVESISCPSEAPVPVSETGATHTKENGTEKLETAGDEIFATEIRIPEDSIMQDAVIPSSDNLGLSDTTELRSQVTVNEEEVVLVESISCPSEAPVPVSETVAAHTKENGAEKHETGGDENFATENESQRVIDVASSDTKLVPVDSDDTRENVLVEDSSTSGNGNQVSIQDTIGVSVSPHHKTEENSSDCISELNQTVACKLPLINGVVSTGGEIKDHELSSKETMEKLSLDCISNEVDSTIEMTNTSSAPSGTMSSN